VKIAIPLIAAATLVVAIDRSEAATIYSYQVVLTAENGSGVSGVADFTLNGNLLTLSLSASGLTPNQVHMDHLHGLLGAAAPSTMPAPPSADVNGDGYVESAEAAPFTGPPLFGTPQQVSPIVYPVASSLGTISYTQTYDITDTSLYDPDMMGLVLTPSDILGLTGGSTVPLVDRIFELHGEFVPAGVDGTPNQLNGFGYDPDMPVAGGMLKLISTTSTDVAEPWSFALLGTGVLGLAWGRRRRLS
jgi:MYXO-CTERM domain-containing protein